MSEKTPIVDINTMRRTLRTPRVDQSPSEYAQAISPAQQHVGIDEATSEVTWRVVGFVCAVIMAVLIYLEASGRLFQ